MIEVLALLVREFEAFTIWIEFMAYDHLDYIF